MKIVLDKEWLMSKQSIKNRYKFLSLLKENTDKNHTITQLGLRKLLEARANDINMLLAKNEKILILANRNSIISTYC